MRFTIKLFSLFFCVAFLLIMLDLILIEFAPAIRPLVMMIASLLLVLLFLLLGQWTSRFWDSFGDGLVGNVQRAEKLRELRERFATERNE